MVWRKKAGDQLSSAHYQWPLMAEAALPRTTFSVCHAGGRNLQDQTKLKKNCNDIQNIYFIHSEFVVLVLQFKFTQIEHCTCIAVQLTLIEYVNDHLQRKTRNNIKMITAVPTIIPRKDSTAIRTFIVYPRTLSSIRRNEITYLWKVSLVSGIGHCQCDKKIPKTSCVKFLCKI